MGQVPLTSEVFTSYLVVGGGRLARHFARYLELESIPFKVWSRKEDLTVLRARAEESSHVLLLISDGAIEEFYRANTFLHGKVVVHCSGALASELLPGAHPLMTFSHELYSHGIYQQIPFVIDSDENPERILPRLRNPIHRLDPSQKALYHALCVMSGNFTILLWEKAFREFEAKLGLPKSVLLPYLAQVTQNLVSSQSALGGQSVLTGPLVRGDHVVINRHLTELKADPYEGVYKAFVAAFAKEKDEKRS